MILNIRHSGYALSVYLKSCFFFFSFSWYNFKHSNMIFFSTVKHSGAITVGKKLFDWRFHPQERKMWPHWMRINYVVFNYHQLFNGKKRKKKSSTYWSSAAWRNNADYFNSNGKIQRNLSNLMGQTWTEKSSHVPESLILVLS